MQPSVALYFGQQPEEIKVSVVFKCFILCTGKFGYIILWIRVWTTPY